MVLYHSTTLLYALLLWNHDLFPTVRNVAAKTTTTSEAMRPFRSIDVLNFHRKNHNDIVLEEEEEDSNVNDELTTKDVQEVFFQQTLNHFSKNEEKDETINKVVVDSTETFQQRYFYTNRYASPDDNEQMNSLRGAKEEEEEEENRKTYAFLCCGGEGPSLTKDVLTDSVHCSGDMIYLAQRLFEEENAIVHLFALEHRYYGKSYPEFPDNSSPVSNENLQYLSSRQAIHDVATFIQYANGHYILNDGNPTKWVTFGGSYPGMVSAWSRYKFPNLVHAAVSNSSPVQAQLDFPEYNNHVAKDLGYDVVGGSAECLDIVSRGHEEIGELLSAEGEEKEGGYEKVAELFHVCNGAEPFYKDVKNKNMFLGDGVIYIPAQGNDPSCGSDGSLCNIANLCDAIIEEYSQSGSAMESLAAIAKRQSYRDCTEVDWHGTLQYLSSDAARRDGVRSWIWQTCNEFGFYQTCEHDSSCPYGKGYHAIEQDLEICEVAFGVPPEEVKANVEKSLQYYGGWDMDGSRIMFANGDVDPWAELSITGGKGSEDLPTVWVKGASHHFWTHALKDTDGEAIEDARLVIHGQVMEWLVEEDEKSGSEVDKNTNTQVFDDVEPLAESYVTE